MMKDYGFPPQVQRWIIGKRLPSDNDTLQKLGVKTPDSPLFLYLFPAKKQGLTKEDFVKQYYGDLPKKMQDKHFKGMQKEDEDGGYHEALEAAGVVEAAGGARPKTPVTPATAEMRFPEVSIANYDDNEGADEIHVSEELVGWQCPQCTFINLPTRPGCAMCSASRPEDYSLPADYEPTGEERVRLQRLTAEEQEAQLAELQARALVDLPEARPQVGAAIPPARDLPANDQEVLVIPNAKGEPQLIPTDQLDPFVFDDLLRLQAEEFVPPANVDGLIRHNTDEDVESAL